MEMVVIQAADLQTMINNAVKEAMKNSTSQEEIVKEEFENELLTRKQVQRIFNVSLPTLTRWGEKNILPCLRMNRSIRYKVSDVQKALQLKKGGAI